MSNRTEKIEDCQSCMFSEFSPAGCGKYYESEYCTWYGKEIPPNVAECQYDIGQGKPPRPAWCLLKSITGEEQ